MYLPDVFRGEGKSPDEPFSAKVEEWLCKFKMEIVMKDMSERLLPFAKDKGGKNFGAVGFCWGAVPSWNICQDELFKAGVVFHPSLQGTKRYGQDLLELTKTLKCPQMLLTAKQEAADV